MFCKLLKNCLVTHKKNSEIISSFKMWEIARQYKNTEHILNDYNSILQSQTDGNVVVFSFCRLKKKTKKKM